MAAAAIINLPVALLAALLQTISPFAVLLVIPVGIVAQAVFLGVVIELVNRVHSRVAVPGLGELFRTAVPHIGRLVAAGFLAGLGIAVGFLLLIVPGLYLLTIWAVFAPAIVVERAGVTGSLGRSQQLVRGEGWQVFFVVVIIAVVTQIVGSILGAVLGTSFVASFLAYLLPSVLLAPVSALAGAVMYFELRRLKETAGEPGGPTGAGTPGQPAYPPAPPTAYPEHPGSQPPPTAPYRQPPPGP